MIWYTIYSKMEMSFWGNFHHWLHRKLSLWQLQVQPVMKITSNWCLSVSVHVQINTSKCWLYFRKYEKNVFTFSVISQHLDDTGSWNPSLWKTMTCLHCIVNIIVCWWPVDTRSIRSYGVVRCFWNVPLSPSEGLTLHFGNAARFPSAILNYII